MAVPRYCVIAFLSHITAFKALQHRTSIKGRAYARYIDMSGVDASEQCL